MSCFIGVFVWGGNLDALWFEVLLFVSVLDASVLKKDMPTAPPKKVQFFFRPKGSQSHRRLREVARWVAPWQPRIAVMVVVGKEDSHFLF